MAEGYCVKCKAKKPISDAVEEIMKNGRKAIKGRCPTCGTVMFKILGGKAAVAAPTSPSVAAEEHAKALTTDPVPEPKTPDKATPSSGVSSPSNEGKPPSH